MGRPPAPCPHAFFYAGFCGCWVSSGALWLWVPAPLILPAMTFSFLALLSLLSFLSHTTPWVSLTHLVHGRDLLRYAMVRPHILALPPFLWAPGTATEHSVRRTSSFLSPRGFGTALKPIYPRSASRTSLGGCAARQSPASPSSGGSRPATCWFPDGGHLVWSSPVL